ncbi:SsrA-binding protein SmpB [Candidatus Daviesbacteria bacterium]|nr:SsrA-binding protein SmpB [Candidatus Daviesbacteria bacterium]
MRIVNKKALRNYHILERLEAGVALLGSEVKSIRAGRLDLNESFIRVLNEEAFLINANIPKLVQTGSKTYDPFRPRKLLLHKSQIQNLMGKTSGKGITLVPVSIYEKNNNFKVDVGLAKSKREFDKRKVLKEKDHQRRIEQELRGLKE